MLGLVPSIHVLNTASDQQSKDVDGRDKPDHDGKRMRLPLSYQLLRDHFTERQIIPPKTQPAVVSVSPASDIVPE